MDINPKDGAELSGDTAEKAGQAKLAVRAELMQRHWSTVTFANLIITFTTVYLFWGHVDPRLLWGWLGCAVLLMSISAV